MVERVRLRKKTGYRFTRREQRIFERAYRVKLPRHPGSQKHGLLFRDGDPKIGLCKRAIRRAGLSLQRSSR